MKYLRKYNESIISDKIDILLDITVDLKDDGLIVDIIKNNPPTFQLNDNGNYITSINNCYYYGGSKNNQIFILIYKIKNGKLSNFNTNELSTIEEFRKTLRSYKLDRSISGGDGIRIFRILKRDLYNSDL